MSSRRFDFELRRYVESEKPVYTKKQRRAFQRLMSGLTVGKNRRERLRFMTLTSSPQSAGRDLNADFRALKMRILRKHYFKMKYWKIRTNEGNGVLHIVFRGKFIPQRWLSEQWADIHKSPIVDIRSLYETRKGLTGIVFYLVGNYLAKQSFERMSWGYSWVFPAFVRSWKHLVEKYGIKRGLQLWNKLLCDPFVVTRQVRLTRFLPQMRHVREKSLAWCVCVRHSTLLLCSESYKLISMHNTAWVVFTRHLNARKYTLIHKRNVDPWQKEKEVALVTVSFREFALLSASILGPVLGILVGLWIYDFLPTNLVLIAAIMSVFGFVLFFLIVKLEDQTDDRVLRLDEYFARVFSRLPPSGGQDANQEQLAKIQNTLVSIGDFQREIMYLQRQPSEEMHDLAAVVKNLEMKLEDLRAGYSMSYTKTETKAESLSSKKILSIYKQVTSEFAHSIKTPLSTVDTAIKNISKSLKDLKSGKYSNEDLQILIQLLENSEISIEYMRDILGQGAGFFPGKPEDINFDDLLWKVERISRGATGSRAEYSSTISVHSFKFNLLNLFVAMVELIENAFEAAGDEGKIEVTCAKERASDFIAIDISNTGKRIPERFRDNAFQGGFSTKGEGHGVGLQIARRVIEAAGGTVVLQENSPLETTFRIRIRQHSEKGVS